MAIYRLGEAVPDVHPDAYVHPDACVIGRVTLGAFASVWPSAVLRGDGERIEVGPRSSVQDGAVVHVEVGRGPTRIGADCVIGHLAQLEGCMVGDGALVGVSSVVLAGARIGAGATVAAHALVPSGAEVPPGMLAVGVPAVMRPGGMSAEAHAAIVEDYLARARRYRTELRRIDLPRGQAQWR